MKERTKRFFKVFGQTCKNMGSQAGKIMEKLEKADKEMNAKLEKATQSY